MSLHIVLGAADSKPTSDVFPVYIGRSGQSAREAMLKSTAPRLLVIANPSFISKNNPRAAENAAAQAAEKKPARKSPA